MASKSHTIRVGVGGWTYEPWRDNFYPQGLQRSRELEYASRELTAIEINATYYGTQKPTSFAKWRDETPEDFVFSLKASRYCTNRRVLAEAGDSIERFVASGISQLGAKLGPIVWQFAPTKLFEPDDFEAFLALLPEQVDGLKLRHALEVRHASFMCADYVELARKYQAATVYTDAEEFPSFADLTGDFAYARLMRADAELKSGYAQQALDGWAACAQAWAQGGEPAELPRIGEVARNSRSTSKPRDVYVYFINGAKERAPAAAMALLKRLAA